MATESNLFSFSRPLAATFASKQYYAAQINSSGQAAVCTYQGQMAAGIVQDNPATGPVSVQAYGITKAYAGGAITCGNLCTVDSSSRVIKAARGGDYVLGVAIDSVTAAGQYVTLLITHQGFSLPFGGALHRTVTDLTAAELIAVNATVKPLVDHSDMILKGICTAGDALIFQGAVWNLYGGTTDYDQDGDMTVQYNTGPVTVSLTQDDGINDGTDGSIGTIKPLATDLAYNQVLIDEDLELKMSASPYSAAGDRLLRVETYFTVFTPATV